MDIHDLAHILHSMYEKAKRKETVCQVNLFGVIYASEIEKCQCTIKDLVRLSGLNMGYIAEVSKGIRLSKYVVPIKKEASEL